LQLTLIERKPQAFGHDTARFASMLAGPVTLKNSQKYVIQTAGKCCEHLQLRRPTSWRVTREEEGI